VILYLYRYDALQPRVCIFAMHHRPDHRTTCFPLDSNRRVLP
jgi:hypothetical protein